MSQSDWKIYIQEIFDAQEIPGITAQNLEIFRDYLRSNLEHPCYLFIADDDGAGFEALLVEDCLQEVDESEGVYIQVMRTSDNKQYILPLAQMECPAEDEANHKLVDAYCSWFIREIFSRKENDFRQ